MGHTFSKLELPMVMKWKYNSTALGLFQDQAINDQLKTQYHFTIRLPL